MPNIVMFFGHGDFDPNEVPPQIPIPAGCKLYLFARHGEEISGMRMTDISYYVAAYAYDAWLNGTELVPRGKFMNEMHRENHLRRVKLPGQMIHNYRLYPPAGLATTGATFNDPNGINQYGIDDFVHVVTVANPAGVTLQQLFNQHAVPGCLLMWMACRADINNVGAMVDTYGAPGGVIMGGVGYQRGGGVSPYFKG
jgi:hypothetical protein